MKKFSSFPLKDNPENWEIFNHDDYLKTSEDKKKKRDQYKTKTINLEDKNAMSDLFKNLVVDGLYDNGKIKSKIMTTFQNTIFPDDVKLRAKDGIKPGKDVEIDKTESIIYSGTASDIINNLN